jgi:hypothetical protein
VTALVEQRSYPNAPPKNASRPYLVFFRASGNDGTRLSEERSLKQTENRVEAHADTTQEAESVLAAAYAALHRWRDRNLGVQGCFARGDADQNINDDGEAVSGQTFALSFSPQA